MASARGVGCTASSPHHFSPESAQRLAWIWDRLEDAVKADQQAARVEAARPTRRGCSETGRTTPDLGSAKSRHRQSTRRADKAATRMVRPVSRLVNLPALALVQADRSPPVAEDELVNKVPVAMWASRQLSSLRASFESEHFHVTGL